MLRKGIQLLFAGKPLRWLIIVPAVALLLYGVSAASLWGLGPGAGLGEARPAQTTADYRAWDHGAALPEATAVAAAADLESSVNLGEPLGPQPEAGREIPITTPVQTAVPAQQVVLPQPTARVPPPPVVSEAGRAQPTPVPEVVVPTSVLPTAIPPTVAPPTAVPPTAVIPTNTAVPPPTIVVPTIAPPTVGVPTVAVPTFPVPTFVPPTFAVPTVVLPTAPFPTIPPPTEVPLPTVEPDVTICHIPPGNPDNAQTQLVMASEVAVHLAHGDTLGPCP